MPTTSTSPTAAKTTTTNSSGLFDLSGLAAGKYIVRYEPGSGIAPAWSNGSPAGSSPFQSEAQVVTLGSTGSFGVPAATLAATGAISGSAPSGWTVRALLWNPHTLTFENTTYQATSTGTYTIGSLPPGEYLVRFLSNVNGVPASYWKAALRTTQGTAVKVAGTTVSNVNESGLSLTRSMQRIAGTTRWDGNALIAQHGFDNPETVFIATGSGFADGLSAAPAAAALGGPLLFVETNSLRDETRAELERLQPKTVVIVGGTASVSPGVQGAIEDLLDDAEVIRISGSTRYDGSRKIARYAFSGYDTRAAYVVAGTDFPDGITAGSAAAIEHAPLLLDDPAIALDTPTKTLIEELGIEKIVIVGGSVPSSKETAYRAIPGVKSVIRIAGTNRYETSAQLTDYAFPAADSVILTTGVNYPDALGGIALAGTWNAPLMLSQASCIPASVRTKMLQLRPQEIYVLGNNNTLSEAMENLQSC